MEYIGISANERQDPSPVSAGYPAHSHSSYELFLPMSHACTVDVNGCRYVVEPNSILLLPPGVSHHLLVQEGEPLHYLFAQFTAPVIPDEQKYQETVTALFHDESLVNCYMRRLSRSSADYARAAMRRLSVASNTYVHECFFSILYPLLLELRLFGAPVTGESLQPVSLTPPQNTLVDEVIEYISLNYADIQNLSFVTEHFHYSTVHVNALFKTRLGVSLWHYILQIRLDRACDLLLSGTRAEAVASACGFGDYTTFYRIFKKCYGISPSECRKTGKKPSMLR